MKTKLLEIEGIYIISTNLTHIPNHFWILFLLYYSYVYRYYFSNVLDCKLLIKLYKANSLKTITDNYPLRGLENSLENIKYIINHIFVI